MGERKKLEILPIVKAYPEPSSTYGITVCVAGVTIPDGTWIRLYPVRFTELPRERRFAKYQPIGVVAEKAYKDSRPESYRIDEESIEILGDPVATGDSWSERKRLLREALFPSMCELKRLQQSAKVSLGMVRVREITDFRAVDEREDEYTKLLGRYEHALADDLFGTEKVKIDALRFKYRYKFICDEQECSGHQASIIDWEAYALHRKMARQYGEETAKEKVRGMYVDYICGEDKDTYFFMGNMQKYPSQFLMLGAFYPKKTDSPTLFEF